MILGICIASIPLVSRATKHHQTQISSLAASFSSLFHYIKNIFTTSTTSDHESNAVYDTERDSESKKYLVGHPVPMGLETKTKTKTKTERSEQSIE